MGLFSDTKDRAEAAQAEAGEVVGGCPDPLNHYDTEVNKGSINAAMLKGNLAVRYKKGYRLAHAFEQNGNTVLIFEHHFH